MKLLDQDLKHAAFHGSLSFNGARADYSHEALVNDLVV